MNPEAIRSYSFPVSNHSNSASSSLDSRLNSSDRNGQLDGDDRLLHLAGHDELWRKQLLVSLEEAIRKVESRDGGLHDVSEEPSTPVGPSDDFGSMLFGENVTNMLKTRRKTFALPPEEVTTVLFELTKRIAQIVPDEITSVPSPSALSPYPTKRQPPGEDVALACKFVLNDALPFWLKSFRPLPWEQRRMIWPIESRPNAGSTAVSSLTDTDSITLESVSTNQISLTSMSIQKSRQSKSLREMIEDNELNGQTREETRFLTTYYFTQKLLPQLKTPPGSEPRNGSSSKKEDGLAYFLKKYGSYISLHPCLRYAAILRSESVIHELLEIAKHDPWHKVAMKQTSKTASLVIYEPTILSAVIQRLREIAAALPERKLATIDLCASAFPDVRPWQVHRECLGLQEGVSKRAKEELRDVYYLYLSQLLHPMYGQESARHNLSLVKEWCELSVREKDNGNFFQRDEPIDRRKNFQQVAARTSSHFTKYKRDPLHLLGLAMEADELDLAVEICEEIVGDSKLVAEGSNLDTVFDTLRTLGISALNDMSAASELRLRRVLRVYRRVDQSSLTSARNIPNELLGWIYHQSNGSSVNHQSALQLIQFLAEETMPSHVLEATKSWLESSASELQLPDGILTVIQTALQRAAKSELLRVSKTGKAQPRSTQVSARGSCEHIWKKMSTGEIVVYE